MMASRDARGYERCTAGTRFSSPRECDGPGELTNQTAWPTDGPERRLLEFLDRVRSDNGTKSLRQIADEMALQSPTRVNRLLRGGALPVDEQQLQHLVRALGGSDEDVGLGQRLYAAVRASRGNSDTRRWARSGYVEQIRQIAPADGLEGRDEELTELSAFCGGSESYVWWVGDPWAGKSALMSTFALSPPPGADVVSFFVTARLSAQSDGPAFIDTLLDQLSSVTVCGPIATVQLGRRRARRTTSSTW